MALSFMPSYDERDFIGYFVNFETKAKYQTAAFLSCSCSIVDNGTFDSLKIFICHVVFAQSPCPTPCSENRSIYM